MWFGYSLFFIVLVFCLSISKWIISTGRWFGEERGSSRRLLHCLSRLSSFFFLNLLDLKKFKLYTWPFSCLTTWCRLVFRSPWWSRCPLGRRHLSWSSVHRKDRYIRQHRREGSADKKGCDTTRLCQGRLEDHSSALRGKLMGFFCLK